MEIYSINRVNHKMLQHNTFLKGSDFMTIEKHRNKWRIKQMYKGTVYYVSLDHKPSQREAERLIYEKINSNAPVPQSDMTFYAAVDNYCNVKSKVLSPTTIRGYHTLQNSLPEYFTQKMLSDIDSIAIQAVINDYTIQHSPKTVRNAYGLITTILNMYNPELNVKCTLPMMIKKEPYIPTDEEVKKLCEAARETDYWIYIMLGAYGLRRSEILAINPDTDLNGNLLTINKSMVYDDESKWVIKKTTKTVSSTREIYIDDVLADAMRKQGYILKAHPSTVFQWMSRTEKKLGIEHFSIHKLRHYFATVMSTLIPEKDWLYLGGWSTDHIAKTVYQHNQIAKNTEQKKKASEDLMNKIIPKLSPED